MKKKQRLIPFAFISPSMLFILTVSIYPIIYTVIISLTNLNMYHWQNPEFIGIQNYTKILGAFNSEFFVVLIRTIVWTIVNMVIHIVLAGILALLLNIDQLKGKGIYRVILILPWAVPGYISTLIWKNMFNYDFGAINLILQKIGITPIDWLTNSLNAMIACTIVNVWLATPFMMVVILGSLQSIDKTYYEAAIIDGASAFDKFRFITLPLLKPAVTPAIIITLFVTFKQFDVIYLMTKGLAGKTDVIITYAYNKAFLDYNYGYSAALSVIIFVILLACTMYRKKMLEGTDDIY